MAIVGTAYVRLRVIGDKLKNDIAKATENAVNEAAPDLHDSGGEAGGHVADGMAETVEHDARSHMDRIGDDIGNALGNAMGAALSNTLRKRMGTKLKEGFSNIAAPLQRVKERVAPVFEDFGERWAKASTFKFKGILSKLLIPAIAGAVTALPSALAFVGAAIGALAATAITAIASLGPAFAGAGLAGIAAFSAVKISAGLIGLALKQQTPQLEDFQGRLDTFKTRIATPIQAGLLSGLNASMRLLTPVVDALEPQLTRLGIAVGDVAIGFADAVRQGANMDRLSRILDTNNQFITDAGGGVSKIGQAFIILLDNLRPVTAEIGQMVGEFGDWILRTTEAGDASGRLSDFITRMWDSTKYFVGILWDFAAGIGNVFTAAFGASGGMMTNLHDIAQNFRAWTGDPANQDRMVTFFEKMRDIAGQVIGVFGQLGGSALRGLEGTNVESFTTALQTLVDVGGSVATFFHQIQDAAGPALQTAFTNFAGLLTDLAESGVLGVVATALSNVFVILSALLNIPGVGALLGLAAGALAMFKTLSLLWTILGPVVEIIWLLVEVVGGALVAAFGWIPIVIALIVAALIWFFTQTEIGRHIIEVVWNAIVAAFNWAKDAIMTAIDAVWGFLKGLWDNISGFAEGVWNIIKTVFTAIFNFYVTIWSAIFSVVSTVLTTIWNVITTVMQAIWNAISGPLNVIFGIWRAILGLIVALVVTYFQIMWGIISTIMQLIMLVITTVWNAIWGFIEPILSTIADFISGVWDAISHGISVAMNFIHDVIMTVWNAIFGFISTILGAIGGFISGVWSTVAGAVGGFVTSIWEKVRDGFNMVVDFIGGIPGKVIGLAGEFLSAGGRVISGLMDGISNGISAAGDFARSVVNKIIDFLNSAIIDGINNLLEFTIPVPGLPDIDINPPDIPRIPHLARGGTISPTTGGTLALIAEAGRSERVEPLDASGLSRRDRAMIDTLTAGGSANVQVYIGTRELTELVDFVVEDHQDRLADRLTTGTKG